MAFGPITWRPINESKQAAPSNVATILPADVNEHLVRSRGKVAIYATRLESRTRCRASRIPIYWTNRQQRLQDLVVLMLSREQNRRERSMRGYV